MLVQRWTKGMAFENAKNILSEYKIFYDNLFIMASFILWF